MKHPDLICYPVIYYALFFCTMLISSDLYSQNYGAPGRISGVVSVESGMEAPVKKHNPQTLSPGPPTVILVPGNIQLNISYISPLCGSSDGSITVSATGGTAPYQFSDDGVSFQSNGNFAPIYSGYHVVFVRDATGQKNSKMIRIDYGSSTKLYVPAYIPPTACNASDGSITVKGSDPSATYTSFLYSMDGVNFQSNNTFSNLSAGNYTFFVQNPAGCIDSAYFPLDPNCALQGVWDYSSTACHNDGHITIQGVTGGTPPYRYSLNGGAFQAGASFTGLAAGLYKIQIKDATGKVMLYSFPIFQACSLTATASPTDASCGNSDGTIAVIPAGGTAPYTYSIDGTHFQAGNVFSGLQPGEYNVTVNDAGGLQSTANAAIFNNCPSRVTAVVTKTSCGYNNGMIKATVINGTPPFSYSIDGTTFQSSDLFTGVPIGTYTLTAIDAAHLKMTTILTVKGNPFIVPQAYALPASCKLNDGIIIVTPPGPGDYTFGLTQFDFQSSNVFRNLYSSGWYTVYMKDPYGCVTFNGLGWVVGTNCINVSAVTADARCGQNTGSITASGQSGAEPYSYSIDGIHFQAGNVFNNLAAGNYTLTIRGADGASNSTPVTVKSNCLQVTITPTDATCGRKNGSLFVSVINGTAPYQYSLDGVNFTTGPLFDNLSAGPYTITVKDAGNGFSQANTSIGNIAGPQLSASTTAATCRNNDGVITVSVNGGTPPYVYSASQNGVLSNGFTGLATGIYQVTVTDANQCLVAGSATVALINDLTVEVANTQPVCEGSLLQLNAVSSATSFSWSPSVGLNHANVYNPVLTASSTQEYVVTAVSGPCQVEGQVLVTVLAAPVPVTTPDITICSGKSVSLSGSGGVEYSWTPATYLDNPGIADPTVVHPEGSVTYSLSVIGANGCASIQPATVAVSVSAPALVFAGNDTTIAIGQPLRLYAIDVNHTGFTNYSWSPADGLNNPAIADPIAVLHDNITYSISAWSDAGCEASGIIRIKVYAGPEIYVPNAFSPNGDGHNDVLKVIPVGISQFMYFAVYNRYGQMVFSTTDPSKGWDGTVNGKPQGTGTFVWQAEGKDYMGITIRRKGTVVLVK
jgi:gliding motility-associated-like protein